MTQEQLFDYATANGWIAVEEFLPEADWTFGMPTWKLTVSKDAEPFATSTRFGMGSHRYGEILDAMAEWDDLDESERVARLAQVRADEADEAAQAQAAESQAGQ